MAKSSPKPEVVRVLRLRVKDKHARVLREKAYWVNQVWNYCNDLSYKVWERERRFMSGFDFAEYTKGASKAGIPLHSQTIQGVSEEFANKRKQSKKVKLRWRKSGGSRRSLGWIPFKASALQYRNGQLWMSGVETPLGLWDSYGLSNYDLGAGSISEDSRGRWYINISVKVARKEASNASQSIGIDLGLKDFATISDGKKIDAQQFYRKVEKKLAMAQAPAKRSWLKPFTRKLQISGKIFYTN